MEVKVSVIVPIFKVEKFIERCVRSLMEQTLPEVEYIFVDDASPDASMDILRRVLEDYPGRATRILTHPVNRGLPAARNTGLEAATGEYIFHCDSDDWVETDMLEKMYSVAAREGADFVYSDFYISFEKNERYMSTPDYRTADEVLRRGFLGGMMKYNVWNKLVSRSLYEGVSFPEGHAMGEDMTIIMLVCKAGKVARVPEALYHYVKLNTGAYSNVISEKNLADIRFNVGRTVEFLEGRYGDAMDREIGYFKLSQKLPFLISDDSAQYARWREWYPEANRYAFSNRDLPLRTRMVQWMAARGCWLGVRLYYKLVYKFVYGVLYR